MLRLFRLSRFDSWCTNICSMVCLIILASAVTDVGIWCGDAWSRNRCLWDLDEGELIVLSLLRLESHIDRVLNQH